MDKQTYDIFISYRRDDGAQYARILQLMLQQRGYRVFLDYDELIDGIFSDNIVAAIKEAPIFMFVLSDTALDRCKNEDDWVRQEIMLAIELKKHIIPVNPDNKFGNMPTDVPDEIRKVVSSHQYSEIHFGQTLGVTVDFMIKNRIAPIVGTRSLEPIVDTDFDAAKQSLEKIDAHNRFMKRLGIAGVTLVVMIVLTAAGIFLHRQNENRKREREEKARTELRMELERKHQDFRLQLKPTLTVEQMNTIDTILQNMKEVRPDSLWVSKFEFSVGQWYGILGGEYDLALKNYPMTEVSLGEVFTILMDTLIHITGIKGFDLPSVEEWEYAAHGGEKHETTVYVGSDNVDEVAWYQGNSGGKAHPCDGQQGKTCNWLDMYDMSGNVAEWCNSSQIIDSDVVLLTVCGGHYNSPSSEVTATSKAGLDPEAREKTVGFRLIIRKNNQK